MFSPYFENSKPTVITIYMNYISSLLLWVVFLAIWFQDSKMYHFSMFHASNHIFSVPATEDEVCCFYFIIYLITSPLELLDCEDYSL